MLFLKRYPILGKIGGGLGGQKYVRFLWHNLPFFSHDDDETNANAYEKTRRIRLSRVCSEIDAPLTIRVCYELLPPVK